MITVADVAHFLNDLAAPALAADWDNIGLLLGEAATPVQRLMTCLTVTPPVVQEATQRGAGAIVSHHPVLFKPVRRISSETAEGRLLLPLLRAGVAVLSPHTAFDNAAGGINDLLAGRLGLTGVRALRSIDAARQCKIVVFVPDADLGRVSDALFGAGAGIIGQYSQCSYRLDGTGTFFGSDAANPTVGQKGRREEVREWRLEVLCPERRVDEAIRAMRAAHSYEEPAYDVYPLRPGAGPAGIGRIGDLPQAMTLEGLARLVKDRLGAALVQMAGAAAASVRTIALACGAAGEMVGDAVAQRADVFLTGELRFHDVLAAQAAGVSLLLPGHYATERCGIEDLAQRLGRGFPGLEVWASRSESDPLLRWV